MTAPAPPTEAACLFDTGALYGRRTLLQSEQGDPVFAGIKPGAFSVYFGDAPIYHFDLEGRWQRAYVDGLHFLKSLDNTVQTIDRVRDGANLVLRRRTLDPGEARQADARARTAALGLLANLDAGRLQPSGPPPKGRTLEADDLHAFLSRVAAWDEPAWSAHRARYLAAYGPLPFLPPDSPAPVVLQATLGHARGVAFGGAPAAPFHARNTDEFGVHARDVAALLGRRIEQARVVFLAGSEALRQPANVVASSLETASRVFPVAPVPGRRHPDPTGETPHRLDGIHAFLDAFDDPLPSTSDWRCFRALGLTRVCLGVESGDPAVRALFGKTWPDAALCSTVSALKAADVGVSLAVLVGAGGVESAGSHAGATATLLNGLGLGPGDLVALLDAREVAGASLSRFTPLTDDAFEAQRDDLRARLAPLRSETRAKVVPYSLDKQGLT